MRRFWFELENTKSFSPLGMGCGITAYDVEDAISILREKVLADGEATVAKVIHDVSIDDLDRNHVLPNIGNVLVRGVWFPQGY